MTNTKKYTLYFGVILVAIIALSLIISKTYTTETQIDIAAPKNVVFNAINDIKTQSRWNSFIISDTSTRVVYPGSTFGSGSSCEYTGDEIEDGVIKIISSHENDSIIIVRTPMGKKESHLVYFMETKDSISTTLRVVATKDSGFLSNLVQFISKWKLKKTIKKDLEYLNTLIDERYHQNLYSGYKIEEINPGPKFFITHRAEVAIENINQYYTQNISALYQKALNSNIVVSGMPCGLFYTWDETKLKSDMAAALPTLAQLNNIPETNSESILAKPALKITFRGDKTKSGQAHNAMGDFMKDRSLLMDVPMIEEYVTDPSKESDPDKWVTNVIYYYTKK